MIIKNGLIFCRDEQFRTGLVKLDGERIKDILFTDRPYPDANADTGMCDDDILDAEGLYVIPGLTDIHFHGCVGEDFCTADTDGLRKILRYELSRGVTQVCPASMTLDEEKLGKIYSLLADFEDSEGSEIVGINMEGPFISHEKRGAQNPEYIMAPDRDMFTRLQNVSGGKIKLCSIAPEIRGAMDFIKEVSREVHVSLAHSDATYDIAAKAFDKGADHVTHLYNGMNGFMHREPGIIGAAADNEDVYVELIGDGVHLHPAAYRATYKMMGYSRICLISDSMSACGMPDGNYELGGLEVVKTGDTARLKGSETIAGSVTDLMDILKIQVREIGLPLEKVISLVTANPAKSIGIYNDYGSMDKGKYANIVILNKELEIFKIIKRGRIING